MSTSQPLSTTLSRPTRRTTATSALAEIALLATLYVAYSASRLLADGDLVAARRRAADLLGVERFLHIDPEAWVNHAASSVAWIGVPMSFWYASLHYVVTPAVLVFLFHRHRDRYGEARNALVIGSALGLAVYILMPVAPPRLMGGYVDTLARFADVGWWSTHASAPAGLGGLTNELAAMPSLHVGWAFWVAWALWPVVGRRVRTVASLYAVGTAVVVVATGNHWVLDAVGGLAVIGVGILAAAHRPHPCTRRELTLVTGPPLPAPVPHSTQRAA